MKVIEEKVFKKRRCWMCEKLFRPTGGNQVYCGNRVLKTGCSYLRRLEYWKKRQAKRMGFESWQEYYKTKKDAWRAKHPEYMSNYWHEHK